MNRDCGFIVAALVYALIPAAALAAVLVALFSTLTP